MRPRNWLYHNYLLNDMKTEALGEGGALADEEREIVRSARSVLDYDERFIAPRYGFRGAEDYYALCTPLNFMPEIRVPTLVLAAVRRSLDPGRALSRVQVVRQSGAAGRDGGGRWPSRLPHRRQRPAVVRYGPGEIPRAGVSALSNNTAHVSLPLGGLLRNWPVVIL